MKLILASKSPRRREILENLELSIEIVTAPTDESSDERDPCRLVELLSERKARAVEAQLLEDGRDLRDTVILASDTVVYADGEILGKPKDAEDAHRMLRMLSGKTHEVISGVCLIGDGKIGVAHEVTKVLFDALDEDTVSRYLATGEPFDKAGAYAIQGLASPYIRGIDGCYFNVVGLPVHRLHVLYQEIFGENLF